MEGNDEIIIRYKAKGKKTKEIKILGDKFVENNKDICTIISNGNEYELDSTFSTKYMKFEYDEYEITLKGITKVTDMSYMFSQCEQLCSVPDVSKMGCNKCY